MMDDDVRVLVVDDDLDAAAMLAELLTLDGYAVRAAHSVAEATTVAPEFRPTAALLDLGLPDGDGFFLATELRRHFGSDLVVVAVTGQTDEETRKAADRAGFDFLLTKPVDLMVFRQIFSRN